LRCVAVAEDAIAEAGAAEDDGANALDSSHPIWE
jgi:hypothetical protein